MGFVAAVDGLQQLGELASGRTADTVAPKPTEVYENPASHAVNSRNCFSIPTLNLRGAFFELGLPEPRGGWPDVSDLLRPSTAAVSHGEAFSVTLWNSLMERRLRRLSNCNNTAPFTTQAALHGTKQRLHGRRRNS